MEARRLLSVSQPAVDLFDAAPPLFVENQGQWPDASLLYAYQGPGLNALITDQGPVLQLLQEQPVDPATAELPIDPLDDTTGVAIESTFVSITFDGANLPTPTGLGQAETVFNYFVGDAATWKTGVAGFEAVQLAGLYQGIDLIAYPKAGGLKYEFQVAPGADYQQIQITYSGVTGLSLDEAGTLHIQTDLGELVDPAPRIYQQINGSEVEVAGGFVLVDADTCALAITGEYDPTVALVIDPDVDWATYVGGTGTESNYGNIAVDSVGNALVTGWTTSAAIEGQSNPYSSDHDVFVAKVGSTGSVQWVTFLGGAGHDNGNGITVDSADNVLVTGLTSSGVFSGSTGAHGHFDAFVAKVSSAGSMQWATYLGGGGYDGGNGIAVDSANNVFVTGHTYSADFEGRTNTHKGDSDSYVAKVSGASGALDWATYLGGSGNDTGYDIAVDSIGNALVFGTTRSTNFEGSNNPYQGGPWDAFAAKVSPSGVPEWATYLGGSGDDKGFSVALASDDTALVTGSTSSANFDGAINTPHGGTDAFVAEISSAGAVGWATYLGGSGADETRGIDVDSAGNALVAGATASTDFVGRIDDGYHGGPWDAFVAKVSPSNADPDWMVYLGGSGYDWAGGIGLDAAGNALVAGETSSTDFEASNNTNRGGQDVFVAKISIALTQGGDSPIPAGAYPVSVAIGDLDADAVPDLVAAVYGEGRVAVMLGNGDGTFGAPTKYQAGSVPYPVAIGDVNGDESPDLVVGDLGTSTVSVLLGNGDGTFQTEVKHEVGGGQTSAVLGDIDGNGTLDIAVAVHYEDRVAVLLGNGDGTFQAPVSHNVGSRPRSVALDDFDGDGRLDLVSANESTNDVSVLLGNGDGTFLAVTTVGVGARPYLIAADDLDADGNSDIVTANFGSGNVSVALGNGDGTFQAQSAYAVGNAPASVAVADIDGDGALDIVTANWGGGNVSVLSGNGDGTFQAQTTYAVGSGPHSVALGDLDGDLMMDVATANSGSNNISVLINQGVPTAFNNEPTADGQSVTTTEDTAVAISLTGDDGDPEVDQALTFALGTGPSHGTVAVDAITGVATYTPDTDYNGPDSFTFTVTDDATAGEPANLTSQPATVSITVTPVNDAPVAVDDDYQTDEDTELTVSGLHVTKLTFDSGVAGTIQDVNGVGTGFTDRLPDGLVTAPGEDNDTGRNWKPLDDNLELLPGGGLEITSTYADLSIRPEWSGDPQHGSVLEAYGLLLPDIGDDDLRVEVLLDAIELVHGSDQLGLYAGTSSINVLRAGLHRSFSGQLPEYTTHAQIGPNNEDYAVPYAFPGDWSNGDEVRLTLTRQDGQWELSWLNLATGVSGASGLFEVPSLIDTEELYVGVFYSNPRSGATKTSRIDDFSVVYGNGVLANDTDAETDALTVLEVNGQAASVGNQITLDSGALLTLNADGSFTYDPNGQFESLGSSDSASDTFNYRATDGTDPSNVALVTLTITGVNDAPVAVDDDFVTDEDTPLLVSGVFAQEFSDDFEDGVIDSEMWTAGGRRISWTSSDEGNWTWSQSEIADPDDGYLQIHLEGPTSANSHGAVAWVRGTYDFNDGAAHTQNFTWNVDVPLRALSLLVQITDDDNIPTFVDSNWINDWLFSDSPGTTNLLPSWDGVSFPPGVTNYYGTSLEVTWSITIDPLGLARLYQGPDGTGPLVLEKSLDLNENWYTRFLVWSGTSAGHPQGGANFNLYSYSSHVVSSGVLANDTDAEGDALTVLEVNGQAASVGSEITLDSGALLTVNADGSFTYDPNGQFESLGAGESATDTFNYRATDGTDPSNEALVTLTITGVNDAPVAVDDDFVTDEDTPLSVLLPGVLDNDTDAETDALTVLEVNGQAASVGSEITLDSGALLTLNADGSFTYDPNGQFESLGSSDSASDTFNYRATDGTDPSNVALVTLTITGVNDAPVVDTDYAAVATDEGQSVANSGTFSDVDQGDSVQITASIGTITQVGTQSGTWSWTFDTNDGPDDSQTVTITATDSDGAESTATFVLTVNNVAPTLDDATFAIPENSPNGTLVGTVTGTDPGDNALVYSIIGETAFAIDANTGEITVADTLQLDYETTPSFTLEVQVADGDPDGIGTATVTISLLNQASITGVVFVDVNENELYEANEPGIDGVVVELLDESSNLVTSTTTSDGGFYLFDDLAPGTYRLYEVQPTGVDDGEEILGSLGGTIPANDTMQLTLARIDAADYMFAELGQDVTSGDTATIGFWQNKHGQSLIALGGPEVAVWLTDNFGNVFGNTFSDGIRDDGSEVAAFFKDQLFRQKSKKPAGPAKVDAQFMAVVLASYFTSSDLAGNVAADFGFNVTDTGVGTKIVNVADKGAAFGVDDGIDLTIMQLLMATNALTDLPDSLSGFAHIYDQNGDGEIDSTEALLRTLANDVYSAINEQGAI